MPKFDVVLGLCNRGGITEETLHSIVNTISAGGLKVGLRTHSKDALIGRSRSILTTQFLHSKEAPFMVFIDSDVVFPYRAVEQLYNDYKAGMDIVGCGFIKSDGFLSVRTWDGDTSQLSMNTITEVEYISTGFMGISLHALDFISRKLPLLHTGTSHECYPFFESGRDRFNHHDFYISEDWDFCDKARDSGFKVFCDTHFIIGHMKEVRMRLNSMLVDNKVLPALL